MNRTAMKPAIKMAQLPQKISSPYQKLPFDRSLFGMRNREFVSHKLWSRREDEILVKAALEQMLKGRQISQLKDFVNYYDSNKTLVSWPQGNTAIDGVVASHTDKLNKTSLSIKDLPHRYDMDRLKWEEIASKLPFRSIQSCRSRLLDIVNNPRPHLFQSLRNGAIISPNPRDLYTAGHAKMRAFCPWSSQDLLHLDMAASIVHRHDSLLSRQNSLNNNTGNLQMHRWSMISKAVGKSTTECRRKWMELEEIRSIM